LTNEVEDLISETELRHNFQLIIHRDVAIEHDYKSTLSFGR